MPVSTTPDPAVGPGTVEGGAAEVLVVVDGVGAVVVVTAVVVVALGDDVVVTEGSAPVGSGCAGEPHAERRPPTRSNAAEPAGSAQLRRFIVRVRASRSR